MSGVRCVANGVMDLNEAPDASAGTGRLESLSISGFRGIDQLEIPRLGRVALVAGKNGVGKTTVLDGVRLYAAHGELDAIRSLLMSRDELTTYEDENGNLVDGPAFEGLFHRNGKDQVTIAIGPLNGGPVLRIAETVGADGRAFDVVFDGRQKSYTEREFASRLPLLNQWLGQNEESSVARCELLGPGLLRNTDLARLWDNIALTDHEALALDALRLIFGNRVHRAAVIGEARGRRVVVRLSDHPSPLPLKSLGEGATRMFGVALALANCRDGILLLDEAENGIHYSLQSQFWGMVLRAAEMHNIQILATTHSKDCINGFADAASTTPDIDANLVRIGWRKGKLRAVEYSTEELETAAEQNIEVR